MPTFAAGDLDYIAKLNELANGLFTVELKSADFTAVKGYWYFLGDDAIEIELPANPTPGDRIRIASATSAVLEATLLRNGENIDLVSADVVLEGETGVNVELVFIEEAVGWRIVRGGAGGSGGLAWGGVQTGAFTAAVNTRYGINFSSDTVTMPAAPAAGDVVEFVACTDARHSITFGRNGLNIDSAAADYVTGTNRFHIRAEYQDGTIGWRFSGEVGSKATATISTGTLTLDAKGGKVTKFTVSLNANITALAYSNLPPSGVPYWAEVELTADGTPRTLPADAATFRWPGGLPPTPTSTNGRKDRWGLTTDDAGTNVRYTLIGQGFVS